jgi:hypothetical protein
METQMSVYELEFKPVSLIKICVIFSNRNPSTVFNNGLWYDTNPPHTLQSLPYPTDSGVNYGNNYVTMAGNVYMIISGEFDIEFGTLAKNPTGVTVDVGTSNIIQ